jgi:hypothetical protein
MLMIIPFLVCYTMHLWAILPVFRRNMSPPSSVSATTRYNSRRTGWTNMWLGMYCYAAKGGEAAAVWGGISRPVTCLVMNITGSYCWQECCDTSPTPQKRLLWGPRSPFAVGHFPGDDVTEILNNFYYCSDLNYVLLTLHFTLPPS